jgi:hypothetical protein
LGKAVTRQKATGILSSILPFAPLWPICTLGGFIAITIEGSNIVSARIGKREKPGWKAGFLIAKSIFRSLT